MMGTNNSGMNGSLRLITRRAPLVALAYAEKVVYKYEREISVPTPAAASRSSVMTKNRINPLFFYSVYDASYSSVTKQPLRSEWTRGTWQYILCTGCVHHQHVGRLSKLEIIDRATPCLETFGFGVTWAPDFRCASLTSLLHRTG